MKKSHSAIKCKAIIFDLDGTLVDSDKCIEKAWKLWARKYNFAFVREVLPICHGRPAIYTMKELIPNITAKELDKMDKEFLDIELNELKGLKPIKGAEALLRSLPIGTWGIATSGSRTLASGRLSSAGLPLPEVMVTAENITNAKPDPESFLKAANQLKVTPKDCVIFEDSPAGIKGALASGAKVIGINVPKASLQLPKPDFVIKNLTEVSIKVSNGFIIIYLD